MSNDKYILKDKTPILASDLLDWAAWMETADRIVAKTTVGESDVSTVFLGLDHSFGEDGAPVLFETLVFGGPMADEMTRYFTWDEAEKGHAEMVRRVREKGKEQHIMTVNEYTFNHFEEAVRREVARIRDQLQGCETLHGFRFDIEVSGRVHEGEVKIAYLLGSSYATNNVTGDSVQAVLDEFLRQHGWRRAHAPKALTYTPTPDDEGAT